MERFVLAIVLLCLPNLAVGQEASREESLADVSSFYVLIEDFGGGLDELELTTDALQEIVELKLRVNGIPVRPRYDGPFLYTNVNALGRADEGDVIYNTKVEFTQRVELDSGFDVWGVTWDASEIGYSDLADASRAIRNSVLELVDRFVEVYLAGNPPRN